MTGNKIEMDLNLQDKSGSIGKRTTEAKGLNKELEKAQKLATGTKTGAQAAKQAGVPIGGTGTLSERDYGAARGTMGATGASARDFAKQAQGLGGLVRLYATWAANIFAVDAAFRSLQEAANVTNMIQGMNQLGAASGMALGSIAKKFAEASGGAISFQEAISATVKATSAGLSTKQFEQLGEVANKASRALGLNMSDAVSRLTRGVTKLEPELLDELGIFTKVGKATEDYAQSVGKSVSSLSDFEKRQAFANAVLKEGLDKYSAIEVAANPFDKLAASVKNLSQQVLSLVNVAITPLVNLLSSSPTALLGVMTGLGVMLLKQAIPALGEYKLALTKSADESAKVWEARSESMKKTIASNYSYMTRMSENEAEARLLAVEKAEARIKKLRTDSKSKSLGQEATRILSIEDYKAIQPKDIKYLKESAKIAEGLGEKDEAKRYKEAANALLAWQRAEEKHLQTKKLVNAEIEKEIANASKLSTIGYARDKLESARQVKARASIVSSAAEQTNIEGMSAAWNTAVERMKTEKLSKLNTTLTGVATAATIAGTGFIRLIGSLSSMLGIVGMVVGTLTVLYSWVSSNAEASEKLSSSVDSAKESFKTATDTFSKFRTTLSIDAVIATSNAMTGLAESTLAVAESLMQFDKASNVVDRLWEGLKGIFGLSMQDTAAKAMAGNITKMLGSLEDTTVKAKFEDKLKTLLDVKDINLSSLDDALESIDPKKLKELAPILEAIRTKSQATAAAARNFSESLKEVDAARKGLSNALKTSDPITTYADALVKQGKALTESLASPTLAAVALKEILTDINKISEFPESYRAYLMQSAQQYNTLADAAKEYEQQLKSIDEQLQARAGARNISLERLEQEALTSKSAAYKDVLRLFEEKRQVNLDLSAVEGKIKGLATNLGQLAKSNIETAINLLSAKSNSALAQAKVESEKSLVGYLPKTVNTIEASAKLEQRSIDIRIQEITALYTLTEELKKRGVDEKIATLKRKSEEELTEADKRELTDLQKTRLVLESKDIKKDIKSGLIDPAQGYDALREKLGFESQVGVLVQQKATVEQKKKIEQYILTLDEKIKQNENDLKAAKQSQDELLQSEKYLSSSAIERANLEEKYYKDTLLARQKAAVAQYQKDYDVAKKLAEEEPGTEIGRAAMKDLPSFAKKLSEATVLFQRGEGVSTAERAKTAGISGAREEAMLKGYGIDKESATARNLEESSKRSNELAKERISLSERLGTVTSEQSKQQTYMLALSDAEIERDTKLREANEAKRRAVLKYNEDLASNSGIITPALKAQQAAYEATYAAATEGANNAYNAQKNVLDLQNSMSERQLAYADTFKKSFESMGDAITEFAKTGKLDFAGLIDSMLTDLLRYEAQAATRNMYKGLGGFSGIASMFGFAEGGAFNSGIQTFAKGGHFDTYGIQAQAFAKGGTFTNSVVSSPTLFKFAQGTGLMGEAGPEAIMPLTRDSNGTLGVRAQGDTSSGKNNVVINIIESKEKAGTQERTTENGVDMINIFIERVKSSIAGDIVKGSGNISTAMNRTYGLNRVAGAY